MNITLNNRPETLEGDEMSIAGLLKVKQFSWKLLIVKVNGQYVKRSDYEHTLIHDNDDVMVLHLITGG